MFCFLVYWLWNLIGLLWQKQWAIYVCDLHYLHYSQDNAIWQVYFLEERTEVERCYVNSEVAQVTSRRTKLWCLPCHLNQQTLTRGSFIRNDDTIPCLYFWCNEELHVWDGLLAHTWRRPNTTFLKLKLLGLEELISLTLSVQSPSFVFIKKFTTVQ